MFLLNIFAGVLLGWSLGANNSANIFGTAVSTYMVRWRTAAVLIAVFVLLGALLSGGPGMETYGHLTGLPRAAGAFCVCLAAALTAAFLTFLKLPISTSQAVVGAIIGVAWASQQGLNFEPLKKVVLCWIGTPIAAAVLSLLLYPSLALFIRRLNLHFLTYDKVMRYLLVTAGIYGAYALGANNVANVTGVFYQVGVFGDLQKNPDAAKLLALLVGGLSIGFGALTYSRRVMLTVGKGIIRLDAFSAFIVVLSMAATVHLYAIIGVPVSTSQAVVGAVLGIGMLKGMRTVSFKTVFQILFGWVMTPIFGVLFAYGLYQLIV
ncbi:MAG: anion permease [Planctomycetes bacterium]|nr:anion permease [Planctomycetota bacterium]